MPNIDVLLKRHHPFRCGTPHKPQERWQVTIQEQVQFLDNNVLRMILQVDDVCGGSPLEFVFYEVRIFRTEKKPFLMLPT